MNSDTVRSSGSLKFHHDLPTPYLVCSCRWDGSPTAPTVLSLEFYEFRTRKAITMGLCWKTFTKELHVITLFTICYMWKTVKKICQQRLIVNRSAYEIFGNELCLYIRVWSLAVLLVERVWTAVVWWVAVSRFSRCLLPRILWRISQTNGISTLLKWPTLSWSLSKWQICCTGHSLRHHIRTLMFHSILYKWHLNIFNHPRKKTDTEMTFNQRASYFHLPHFHACKPKLLLAHN